MTIESVRMLDGLAFRSGEDKVTENKTEAVKTDFVRSPDSDEIEISSQNEVSAEESTAEENSDKPTEVKQGKKRHLVGKIALGIVSSIVLIYGSIVLKRKLSKPSFEEVQRCFKEIFEKDLTADEVKTLIEKYKSICKNDSTENFTKEMIEQLKKDYGIEKVKTKLTVTKLQDDSLSTTMNQTELGNASPLGEINIMPSTSKDNLIRSIQGETFKTGFHELKHMKQFADAYRANPDKFAEAIIKVNVTEDGIKKSMDKTLEKIREKAIELKNTKHKDLELDYIIKEIRKNSGISTDKELRDKILEATKKNMRAQLDERFGQLELYKAGTPEYERGMRYIKSYEEYPDPETNYEAYRANLLEKEAWQIEDDAGKIYKYSSSIWKI